MNRPPCRENSQDKFNRYFHFVMNKLLFLSPAFSKKSGGTLFLVFRGAWCVVRGAWRVVRGAWCVVRGAWRVVRGAWCVVPSF